MFSQMNGRIRRLSSLRRGEEARQEIGMNKSTQMDLEKLVWPQDTEGIRNEFCPGTKGRL
jgi:hypothetical protein